MMSQIRQYRKQKNKKLNDYSDDEDYIKRSNEDRSQRERSKKKSHDQYSKSYLDETAWMQRNSPFDDRRKK